MQKRHEYKSPCVQVQSSIQSRSSDEMFPFQLVPVEAVEVAAAAAAVVVVVVVEVEVVVSNKCGCTEQVPQLNPAGPSHALSPRRRSGT